MLVILPPWRRVTHSTAIMYRWTLSTSSVYAITGQVSAVFLSNESSTISTTRGERKVEWLLGLVETPTLNPLGVHTRGSASFHYAARAQVECTAEKLCLLTNADFNRSSVRFLNREVLKAATCFKESLQLLRWSMLHSALFSKFREVCENPNDIVVIHPSFLPYRLVLFMAVLFEWW